MDDFGITQYRLAKELGIQHTRISQILKGQRAITADTAMRLGRFFGTSSEMWMNLQQNYDLELAMREKETRSHESSRHWRIIPNLPGPRNVSAETPLPGGGHLKRSTGSVGRRGMIQVSWRGISTEPGHLLRQMAETNTACRITIIRQLHSPDLPCEYPTCFTFGFPNWRSC
jgi:addiction module HigA family antidote